MKLTPRLATSIEPEFRYSDTKPVLMVDVPSPVAPSAYVLATSTGSWDVYFYRAPVPAAPNRTSDRYSSALIEPLFVGMDRQLAEYALVKEYCGWMKLEYRLDPQMEQRLSDHYAEHRLVRSY